MLLSIFGVQTLSFNDFMLVILLAALSNYLLLLWFIPFLRRQFIDLPNDRSSHCRPTPRGGGFSFVIIASASSGLALISGQFSPLGLSPLFFLPLAVVGFVDDRRDLHPAWRYLAQLLTSIVIVFVSPLIKGFGLSGLSGSFLLLLFIALLVIGVTAVINFINFMDGLDGLVSGCLVVVITSAAIQLSAPWPIWALVGSLLGFMCWNWSPAKVFMGDVGSTFLGAIFALLVLQESSWPEAIGLLLVSTPLLGDACLCVLRRLMAGHAVFQAHRLHLFQRLHLAGWSHAQVSTFYISATASLAIAFLWGGLIWVIPLSVVELLIGVWLDQQVAVPFAVASCD
jgi:UDP-N-acetylmuramyl pentapeptide phosphotransferase/UDP-N-acetylglucosamine-1-phosphate transferase